jgi:hypothetical protein
LNIKRDVGAAVVAEHAAVGFVDSVADAAVAVERVVVDSAGFD